MTKKTVKSTNSIVDTGLLSKNRTWMEIIKHEASIMSPGRLEWRERLINTLMMWAEKPSSLEIMQFCIDFKITRSMLYAWASKYKDVGEALNHVRLMIACHRKVGAMTKALDGSYAYRDMHMLDPEWHSVNKYHADLKKDEERQAHTFIISTEKPKVVTKEEMQGNDDRQDS